MAHRYSQTVRFGEVDRAGIVYYPRLLHFSHVAMEDFFDVEVGQSYQHVIDDRRIGFPTVHLEADFSKPMAFGDRIVIEVTFVSVGRSSVVTRYRFLGAEGDDGDRRARIDVTTACVDMDRFRAREIPDDLRACFEKHPTEDAAS
ncbi:MAG: thioesterase family protein [Acidobacteriota bacterium]